MAVQFDYQTAFFFPAHCLTLCSVYITAGSQPFPTNKTNRSQMYAAQLEVKTVPDDLHQTQKTEKYV